ncbi:helicase [Microbacterium sp. JZ31]|uniref:helicase n=1 Tax=Microbacterium sp. JZ31 TaxID=1906274 RepID=UPI001EE4DE4F|nr:helicase [Microbacterium sp. JZ31]
MAGSALAAGVAGATAALMLGLTLAGAAAVESQRIASVADAAALAAADAASGAITGDPCGRAAEVAGAQRASVASCALDGLIATVTVGATFAGLPVGATARAGPPPLPG